MRTYIIQPEDDGMRLNRFLERMVPALPQSLLYKYLRSKRIKCNNQRCEAATRLAAGDELQLYINDEFFETAKADGSYMLASNDLRVYYEDDNIAILYKPAGLLCHAANVQDDDTLINRFLRYLSEKGEYLPNDATVFTPALCNRLDRNTEGLVIAAKNAAALRGMNDMIANRRIEKNYLAVVSGELHAAGVFTAYISKDEATNIATVSAAPHAGAKKIVTAFHTLACNGDLLLLDIELLTGRTHQIRAHLAYLGLPILGDTKYGKPAMNRTYNATQQALCAYKLRFRPDPQRDRFFQNLAGMKFKVSDVGFVTRHFSNVQL